MKWLMSPLTTSLLFSSASPHGLITRSVWNTPWPKHDADASQQQEAVPVLTKRLTKHVSHDTQHFRCLEVAVFTLWFTVVGYRDTSRVTLTNRSIWHHFHNCSHTKGDPERWVCVISCWTLMSWAWRNPFLPDTWPLASLNASHQKLGARKWLAAMSPEFGGASPEGADHVDSYKTGCVLYWRPDVYETWWDVSKLW